MSDQTNINKNSLSKEKLDKITYDVIGAAIEVQKVMGRGYLESVYHACMVEELRSRNISFLSEFHLDVYYKDFKLPIVFRCDLFVEDCLVVELKCAKENFNVFEAKLMNYMKILKAPKGILINFNSSSIFKDGQKTYVNEYYKLLS